MFQNDWKFVRLMDDLPRGGVTNAGTRHAHCRPQVQGVLHARITHTLFLFGRG
jgi:hypothetical protein